MQKRCSKCHKTKLVEEFHKNCSRKDGFCHWCRRCASKHRQQPEIKAHKKERQREYNQRRKTAAINRIGGIRCVLCGCKELMFLTIDHANGNGHEHRKLIKGNGAMCGWILKATNVELRKWNLRALCGTCQMATEYNSDEEVEAAICHEHKRIWAINRPALKCN